MHVVDHMDSESVDNPYSDRMSKRKLFDTGLSKKKTLHHSLETLNFLKESSNEVESSLIPHRDEQSRLNEMSLPELQARNSGTTGTYCVTSLDTTTYPSQKVTMS